MHQEVGAEIAADKIMAVMHQPVEWLIEAPPRFIPPPER
jgi:hypothetical protein